jgi:hypothetical protein
MLSRRYSRECRRLGYKNQVRTSQETHYVSATEPSQLMLYTVWGFHGGDYEECRPLGCYAVWHLKEPTFFRNMVLTKATWRNIPEDGILHLLLVFLSVHKKLSWCWSSMQLLPALRVTLPIQTHRNWTCLLRKVPNYNYKLCDSV